MNIINKGFLVCGQEFRQWRREYKLYVVFMLLCTLLYQHTNGLFSYAKIINYPVSPWLLPFLTGGSNGRLAVYSCALLFFSNIFNDRPINRYQYIRCGHSAFLLGKLIYILLSAVIYSAVIVLLLLLPRLNNICMEAGWGKTLGSWSRYSSVQIGGSIPGSTYLTEWFTPAEGMFFSFLLLWMSLCILGMVIYLLNFIGGKIWGILTGGILLGLDLIIAVLPFPRLQGFLIYLSPLSWSNLTYLRYNGKVWPEAYPSVEYAIIMSCFVIIILMIVCWGLTQISYRSGCKRQFINLTGD